MHPRLRIVSAVMIIIAITATSLPAQESLDALKQELVLLQRQLDAIDERQLDELGRLDASAEKDEFETTRQWEVRSAQRQARWFELYKEMDDQQGSSREAAYRRINEILRTESRSTFPASLGTYDADLERFPVYVTGNEHGSIRVPLAEARSLKESFQEAKLVGMIGLLLDENSRPRDYLISGQITFRGKSYRLELGKGMERLMFMMFGNYNGSYSRMRVREGGTSREQTTGYARHLVSLPFSHEGQSKLAVITKATPTLEDYGCHVCALTVSVGVFTKNGDEWKLSQMQKNIGTYGSFGEMETPQLVRISDTNYALRFDWYYMAQGNEEAGQEYYSLEEGIFRKILSLKILDSNAGALPSVKDHRTAKSLVTLRPSGTSRYFEVVVRTSGKRPTLVGNRHTLTGYTTTDTYKFVEGRYVRQ